MVTFRIVIVFLFDPFYEKVRVGFDNELVERAKRGEEKLALLLSAMTEEKGEPCPYLGITKSVK